jgi:hypothetical protein
MVVTLLHVVAVLLVGLCFLVYWVARRGRPVRQRRSRRVSPAALEGTATALGLLAIVVAVTLKITSA